MAQTPPKHLLNTSWTSHRLSPLHHSEFPSLVDNPVSLSTYATRLHDHLTNALAEAHGWTEDATASSSLSSLGALKSCSWETISSLSSLSTFPPPPQNGDSEPCGILVTLTYENNTTYKAALLAPVSPTGDANKSGRKAKSKPKPKPTRSSKEESTYLPLLLTRLPKPLRETFVSFLSASFDTFCSPLRLSSQFMCAALQTYTTILLDISPSVSQSSAARTHLLEDIVKEMQLTLSFSPPISPALKTLNVNIPRGSFTNFISVSGSALLSGSSDGDINSSGGKILAGLETYLHKHLAMQLGLDGVDLSLAGQYVRLTRIACAGFVVASDGRLKVVVQERAADEEGEVDERYRSASRAGEALLHAMIQKAVTERLE